MSDQSVKGRPKHLPLKANPAARNPLHWATNGYLNAAGLRELGRLIADGHGPREIARRTGMAQSAISHKAPRIAKALGVPMRSKQIQAGHQDIADRLAAGASRKQIAEDLGIDRSRVDRVVRTLGLTTRRRVPLTEADEVEMKRRILLGHPLIEIARDVKCSVAAVSVRNMRLKAAGVETCADPRRCQCGWKHGHRGRCKISPTEIASIGTRLRDGVSMGMIARELGRPLSSIENHGTPMLAKMAADGERCPCGKPRGHRFSCTAFPSPATVKLRADVLAGLEAGQSRSEIARELGREPSTIGNVANPILNAWAAEGRKCGCGKPINHRSSCAARERGKPRSKSGLAGLPIAEGSATGRRILYRLNQGWPIRHIACDLGIKLDTVKMAADACERAATAAGRPLPDCRCGLVREHPGRCQVKRRLTPFAYRLDKRTVYLLRTDYRLGRSVKKASRLRGIGEDQIAKIFDHWAATSKAKVKPCPCGLPARHPGFCSTRAHGSLPARLLARIDPMIREGSTVSEVADALNLSFMTVSVRSAEARADLVRRGITCGCGRPLGHPYWCSATWERLDMPRGHIPLERELARSIKKALVAGEHASKIATDTGIGVPTILRLRRELSPADLEQRRRSMRNRFEVNNQNDSEAYAAMVIERVQAAIRARPLGAVSKETGSDFARSREDIRNDLYLAVMEGRIDVEQIEAAAGRMLRNDWWDRKLSKSVSFDAPLDGGNGRSLADVLSTEVGPAKAKHAGRPS